MSSYLNRHNPQIPTQREPLDARQVENAAGGFVYQIDAFSQLNRFLILGTCGGSMYESENELTKENIEAVIKAIRADGKRVVQITHDISVAGRARKVDMALFTLALCLTHGDAEAKKAVERVFNAIVRTGTHLMMFVNFLNNMRGWGRVVKRIVSRWYEEKDTDTLAYQVAKYRHREGWTHKDILRMCHGGRNTPIFRWIVDADLDPRQIKRQKDSDAFTNYPIPDETTVEGVAYPRIIEGFMEAKALGNHEADTQHVNRMCHLIREYGLTHEMIPNTYKNTPKVWECLLEKMPIGATLRNLGRLSSLGLLTKFSDNQKTVMNRFTPESIKKGRLHPLTILLALRVYESGEGVLGNLKWSPNQRIISHLNDAFYWGFDAVEPSGKNVLLALDVSGSMFWNGPFKNCPTLTCGDIAAVMAMVTARVEPNHILCCFDHKFEVLPITEKASLEEVLNVIRDRNFGATDAALPMLEALRRKWRNVDGFAIYTDNDTWIGHVHPKQALQRYRDRTGMNARCIAVSMLATDTTICDGFEPYMLDIVGMSTDTPQHISAFLKGAV